MKNDYLREQYLLSKTTRRNSNKEIDQSSQSMWSLNCSKSFLKFGTFFFFSVKRLVRITYQPHQDHISMLAEDNNKETGTTTVK